MGGSRSRSRSQRRKNKWGDEAPPPAGPPPPAPGDAPEWVREMFNAPQQTSMQNQYLQQALAMQQRPQGMPNVPTMPTVPVVPTVEKAVYVEDSLVGKLIGKQGANIEKMRRESGSDIQFDKESIPGGVRRVVLSGTQAQVDGGELTIQLAVQDLMSGRRIGSSMPGQPSQGPGMQEPMITKEMRLEPPLVGAFIGPKGAHVSALREQVGCKLEVRNDHYSGGSSDATILIGPGAAMIVNRAIQMVEAKIEDIRNEKASQPNFKGRRGTDFRGRGRDDFDDRGKGRFANPSDRGGRRFGDDRAKGGDRRCNDFDQSRFGDDNGRFGCDRDRPFDFDDRRGFGNDFDPRGQFGNDFDPRAQFGNDGAKGGSDFDERGRFGDNDFDRGGRFGDFDRRGSGCDFDDRGRFDFDPARFGNDFDDRNRFTGNYDNFNQAPTGNFPRDSPYNPDAPYVP